MASFENITYDKNDSKMIQLQTLLIKHIRDIFELEDYDTVAEYVLTLVFTKKSKQEVIEECKDVFQDSSEEIINWLWPQIDKIIVQGSRANKDSQKEDNKDLLDDITKEVSKEFSTKERKNSDYERKRKNSGVFSAAVDSVKNENKRGNFTKGGRNDYKQGGYRGNNYNNNYNNNYGNRGERGERQDFSKRRNSVDSVEKTIKIGEKNIVIKKKNQRERSRDQEKDKESKENVGEEGNTNGNGNNSSNNNSGNNNYKNQRYNQRERNDQYKRGGDYIGRRGDYQGGRGEYQGGRGDFTRGGRFMKNTRGGRNPWMNNKFENPNFNNKNEEGWEEEKKVDANAQKTEKVEGGEDAPKKKVIRCKNFPNCKNDKCEFHHPTETCKFFPDCKFGNQCMNIHPNIPCKYGFYCTRIGCSFLHSYAYNQSFQPYQPMHMMGNPYMPARFKNMKLDHSKDLQPTNNASTAQVQAQAEAYDNPPNPESNENM